MNLKSLTKSQLIDRLNEMDLHSRVLGRELERLRTELSIAKAQPKANTQRVLPVHFASARELAMRTGRSVRVGV